VKLDLEQDLRIASDEMLRTLEQLERLEIQKRAEVPGTPHFVKLANEIERLATIVFAQTNRQKTLAEESHAAKRVGAELAPIAEVESNREVAVILGEWRDAERRLAASAVETAEHAKAAADVRRLRQEYHRAHKTQSRE
jgi:hypothetical protein